MNINLPEKNYEKYERKDEHVLYVLELLTRNPGYSIIVMYIRDSSRAWGHISMHPLNIN